MQPDNQNNYWKPNSEVDEITDTYTPELIADEPVQPDYHQPAIIDNAPVYWSASEYIHEEKNTVWFVFFAITVVAFIATDIFLLKSYTFSALVVVMAIAVIIYSRRPPRIIDYALSADQGLYVGETLHHFSEFKSFGLINDQNHHSIMLIPIKRFSAGVSVYFPKESGEQIVDILGARLPMENLKLDIIDIIVRKLRL
jgi:hypothetical protein